MKVMGNENRFEAMKGFHHTVKRKTKSPEIRLSYPKMRLNQQACEVLGNATHVCLLYDLENHRIALQPAVEDPVERYAYTLCYNKNKTQATASVKNFLKQYGILNNETIPVKWDGRLLSGVRTLTYPTK
jgi:hypothetical protein